MALSAHANLDATATDLVGELDTRLPGPDLATVERTLARVENGETGPDTLRALVASLTPVDGVVDQLLTAHADAVAWAAEAHAEAWWESHYA